MLDISSRIYVAGHNGLVGSAIWNNLKSRGYTNLFTHWDVDKAVYEECQLNY